MTTLSQANAAIRSVIEAAPPVDGAQWGAEPLALLWYGDSQETNEIPEFPKPFLFTYFEATISSTIERGGGAGHLRHRNPASASVMVFVPKETGQQRATDIAERVAHLFRGQIGSGVVIESVTPYPAVDGSEFKPPGVDVDVGNYMVAVCGIEFRFDLIG